jgi:hypothetical protein
LKERMISGNIDLPCLAKIAKKVLATVLTVQWQNVGRLLRIHPCYNSTRDAQQKEAEVYSVFSGQQGYRRLKYGEFV